MGVGGFLLGSRTNGNIRVTGAVAIPCTHANGPGFALDEEDLKLARELAGSLRSTQLVGCYLSKTRGNGDLNDQDVRLFRALCPEKWQIALLLRPSTFESFQVSLFSHGSDNKIVAGGARIFEILEKAAIGPAGDSSPALTEDLPAKTEPVSEKPAVASAVAPPAAPVVEATPSAPSPRMPASPVAHRDPAPGPKPAEVHVPSPQPRPVALPVFSEPLPGPRYPWLKWVLASLLFVALAALWVTRYSWLPRPPLSLSVSDAKGHMSIRWNPDAVKGLDGGLLTVAEDGVTHPFPLSQSLLQGGSMDYDRKSRRVTVMLKAGDTREIASFLEPAPPADAEKTPVVPATTPKAQSGSRKP